MADFKYIITDDDRELSIKELLRNNFKFSSRFMTQIKYKDLATLNGVSTPLWVKGKPGDCILVKVPDESSDFPCEDIPIDVVYEDDDLLIINKRPGYVVHPTKGQPEHTIANGIMKYMADTNQSFKIRFANRLDRDTSGLLIVAKNSYVQNDITKQMQKDRIHKEYIALVKGIIEDDNGNIDLPIGRPSMDLVQRAVLSEELGGYASVTHYAVVERFATGYTLVKLRLETGRTHQIRVHMAHIGHPVLGDTLYDIPDPLINRQALHAYHLQFIHPCTRESMDFNAPIPKDIENAINKLRNRN